MVQDAGSHACLFNPQDDVAVATCRYGGSRYTSANLWYRGTWRAFPYRGTTSCSRSVARPAFAATTPTAANPGRCPQFLIFDRSCLFDEPLLQCRDRIYDERECIEMQTSSRSERCATDNLLGRLRHGPLQADSGPPPHPWAALGAGQFNRAYFLSSCAVVPRGPCQICWPGGMPTASL